MGYDVAIVNAFTGDHAYTDAALLGNPAGVCLTSFYPPDETMQDIAARAGLPETAFIAPRADNEYDLRWFTPQQEVDLCSHTTLAAAHHLRELELVDTALPVHFMTQGGMLTASYQQQRIVLDLLNEPGQDAPVTPEIAACFDVPLTACQMSRSTCLVEVETMQALRNCAFDLECIAALDCENVIITADGHSEGYDYAYRCFAPRLGITEDPVTGSANCMLAEYWGAKLGKKRFRALQCSARGGELHVELDGMRVYVAGKAETKQLLHIAGESVFGGPRLRN